MLRRNIMDNLTNLFHLSKQERINREKVGNEEVDFTSPPFHIDTEKYFNLYGMNYYLSVHERFRPVQLHTHATSEINYVYSGTVTQWIDGKKFLLKEEDIVVLDQLVPHAIETTGENDIMINLQMFESFFSGSFIKQFTSDSIVVSTFFSLLEKSNQMNFLIFHTEKNERIKQTIDNMLNEHFHPKAGSSEMMKAYMVIFFGELLRSTDFYVNKEYLNLGSYSYIPDILKYIEDNYKVGSLKAAAEDFSISTIHLSRLLKKYVGKTFKQLVHEKRVAAAHTLLLSTDLPVYEIAEEVGYSNLNIFNQKFKETYHSLPGELR